MVTTSYEEAVQARAAFFVYIRCRSICDNYTNLVKSAIVHLWLSVAVILPLPWLLQVNCTPCQGHFLLFVVENILLFFYNSTQWIITCCYIFIIFIWRYFAKGSIIPAITTPVHRVHYTFIYYSFKFSIKKAPRKHLDARVSYDCLCCYGAAMAAISSSV